MQLCRSGRRLPQGRRPRQRAVGPQARRVPARAAGLVLLVWLAAVAARADSVVLKIRAVNPSAAERQKVEVRAQLPTPAKPENVLRSGDLEVTYDVATRTYSVHKLVDLAPKEVRTFEIELQDVWVVPLDTLDELAQHAQVLAAALKGFDQGATARRLHAAIEEGLRAVRERQEASSVTRVKPLDHIRAYESNLEALAQARKDLGVLENLAVGAGIDPEKILGSPRMVPAAESSVTSTNSGAPLVIRIQVSNPSLTVRKPTPLKRELPMEVQPGDVLDTGGLKLGYDAGRKVTYVYLDDLVLGPQEKRGFEVRVRNPWVLGSARQNALEARTKNLLALASLTRAYKSVEDEANAIQRELAEIRKQQGPAVPGDEYVAFHRQQAARLDGLQSRVVRLEELFQPRQQPQPPFVASVLNVRAPSPRTTWIIIYIILGFLGVLSLLFFLRWYGRSRAEKIMASAEAPRGGDGAKPAPLATGEAGKPGAGPAAPV